MSTVNLYDVLDVSQDCTISDIKKAYRKLVILYHPDREGGDEEMFELVTHAYEKLSNPTSRAEYDNMFRMANQSGPDHLELKKKSYQWYNSSDSKKTKEEREKELKKKRTEFQTSFDEMDRKRNYRRDESVVPITSDEAKIRMKDLALARDDEDTENMYDNLFEDKFDLGKFNAVFDHIHRGPTEIIPHEGNPDPWNTIDGFSSNYADLSNYDNIYVDDDVATMGTNYSGIHFDEGYKNKKISKKEVKKINSSSYTKNHNSFDDDYERQLKQKMEERSRDTTTYNGRKFEDYNKQDFGGYGIFDSIGDPKMLEYEDEDIKKKYQRLLSMRNKKD